MPSLRTDRAGFEPALGLGAIGLLSCLQGAGAQPAAPDPGSGALALPEMSVTGAGLSRYRAEDAVVPGMPTNVRETPQSIDVLPRALLEERGVTSLREALRSVTGISLSSGEGSFSGDSLTLRGFNANNDFYIDGIRDAANYNRDPFNIQELEVLKGPSAVLFGRGSSGGVINQTSRVPVDGTFGQVTGTMFAPLGGRIATDLNMSVDQVAVRLNAMGQSQEVANRDHVRNQRFGLAPSITWGLGGDTQVTFSYLHQDENNVPDFGIPYLFGRPAPVPRNSFYGLANIDRERYTTDVLTGTVQHDFGDGVTLRNVTRYGSYRRNIVATEPLIDDEVTRQTPLSAIGVVREPQIRAGVSSILENQTELRAVVVQGSLKHSIVAGVEVGRESAQLRRWTVERPDASLLLPDFFQSRAPDFTDGHSLSSDALARTYRLGMFLADQVRIGSYFELLGSLRFDSVRSSFADRLNTGQNFARTDNGVGWRTALVFKPIDTVRTYVAAGTAFNSSVETLVLSIGNANLAPERNRTIEAGAAWEIAEDLVLRAALFHMVKSNARTIDPDDATVNVLNARQRVNGFELSAAGTILPGWNVIGGYTYLDSRTTKSSNPLEVGAHLINTPRHNATAWTTYDLPRGVTVGGGATYVDSRFGDSVNVNRAPAFLRFDATLAWQITEKLVARANALNLTDKRYFAGVNTDTVLPAPGRTFIFSLSARF